MKLYKWFVWNKSLQMYIPVEGLFPFSRSEYPLRFGAMHLFYKGLDKSFSIPFFN